VAPESRPRNGNWAPGDGPSQVLRWAVNALAKAGTLAIIGVHPEMACFFPVGIAMNRNLTIKMGNCNHRRYLPDLLELVQSGVVDPSALLTKQEPLPSAIDAYRAFDKRQPGWLKVELLAA
jgi:threonine dehydrogenase-like Zn-dependent dehydrogenase